MKKIASFEIDHDVLERGFYLSRVDRDVFTYDLRFKKPNGGDYLDNKAMHSIEHMMATVARNSDFSDKVVYFGPMGCRTGFYLILAGSYESKDIVPLLKEMYRFMADFEGEVPGASAKDCGNYLDMNLPMANYWGARYCALLENITPEHLRYPADEGETV